MVRAKVGTVVNVRAKKKRNLVNGFGLRFGFWLRLGLRLWLG